MVLLKVYLQRLSRRMLFFFSLLFVLLSLASSVLYLRNHSYYWTHQISNATATQPLLSGVEYWKKASYFLNGCALFFLILSWINFECTKDYYIRLGVLIIMALLFSLMRV